MYHAEAQPVPNLFIFITAIRISFYQYTTRELHQKTIKLGYWRRVWRMRLNVRPYEELDFTFTKKIRNSGPSS